MIFPSHTPESPCWKGPCSILATAPEMTEFVVRMGHARNERGFLLFWFYSLVNPLVYKLVDFSLCLILSSLK